MLIFTIRSLSVLLAGGSFQTPTEAPATVNPPSIQSALDFPDVLPIPIPEGKGESKPFVIPPKVIASPVQIVSAPTPVIEASLPKKFVVLPMQSSVEPPVKPGVIYPTPLSVDAPVMPPSVITPADPAPTAIVNTITTVVPAGPRIWGSFDYLSWNFKQGQTPPLITTSNSADQGVIGRPSTQVVFGGEYGLGVQSGYRGTIGGWLNDSGTFGLEASVSYFSPHNSRQADVNTTSTSQVLAVPFNNVAPGAFGGLPFGLVTTDAGEGAYLVGGSPAGFGFPNLGRIVVDSSSQLWGTELNAVFQRSGGDRFKLEALAGLRYMELNESLNMTYTTTPDLGFLGGGFGQYAPYLISQAIDNFYSKNQFFGGQMGARGTLSGGRFSLSGTAKVALGATRQTTDISGFHFNSGIGISSLGSGPTGIFASTTNSGRHRVDQFSAIPEIDLTAAVNVTRRVKLTVGYDFLYWTNVSRPGDQIDRNVNVNNLSSVPIILGLPTSAGPATPIFTQQQSDFWAHGVTFGVQYKY